MDIRYLKCIALAWVGWGWLLTAVKHGLEPVLIFQCEEAAEIMVKLIFNAYGPQELDVSAQTKLNFWQNLEKEIMSAHESNC